MRMVQLLRAGISKPVDLAVEFEVRRFRKSTIRTHEGVLKVAGVVLPLATSTIQKSFSLPPASSVAAATAIIIRILSPSTAAAAEGVARRRNSPFAWGSHFAASKRAGEVKRKLQIIFKAAHVLHSAHSIPAMTRVRQVIHSQLCINKPGNAAPRPAVRRSDLSEHSARVK